MPVGIADDDFFCDNGYQQGPAIPPIGWALLYVQGRSISVWHNLEQAMRESLKIGFSIMDSTANGVAVRAADWMVGVGALMTLSLSKTWEKVSRGYAGGRRRVTP